MCADKFIADVREKKAVKVSVNDSRLLGQCFRICNWLVNRPKDHAEGKYLHIDEQVNTAINAVV